MRERVSVGVQSVKYIGPGFYRGAKRRALLGKYLAPRWAPACGGMRRAARTARVRARESPVGRYTRRVHSPICLRRLAQDAGTELGSSRHWSSRDSRYAALVPLMNSSCILLFGVGAGCAGGTAENALAGNVRIAAMEPGAQTVGAPERYIADAPLHPPVEAVEKFTTPDE